MGTSIEDLEGGWLPSINGFSSGVRSMMKDFGLKIFVSSSVHSKGTYGFATGIVVDVANIVVIIWLLLWLTVVVSIWWRYWYRWSSRRQSCME